MSIFTDDPYADDMPAPPAAMRKTRLADAELPTGDVGLVINEDGTADIEDPVSENAEVGDHYENLALRLEEGRLDTLCQELLDAIEQDKQAREGRDKQYDEGLRRTGLGNDAPGGATFPGASRVVHPVLTEAAIDFGGAVMNEMLPPGGPVKAAIVGDETDAKNERAKRVARHMNYQLTEEMPSSYHEFEVGFSQVSLGGAFYTKLYEDNGKPAVAFIPIDHVYRPWNDGDFYSQPRITHRSDTDKWDYRANVRSGLWRDIGSLQDENQIPEETASDTSNDRIIGRTQPTENVDGIRLTYETSCLIPLENDEAEVEPYLVTIDVTRRKILSIYRNWDEEDEGKRRLEFLIEWPFWPWRGGYPIGMTHMIGGLSGAATGALRALLDAATLSQSQTGVKLKGGSTSGGQNIQPRIGETTEVQGSLAADDIRKTFMPLPFPQPSPTLFNLLGFLVDAAKGVVRTTFDEYDKLNGQTPVGTAQMFMEQGMRNFGAVHGRLHRSMRRFLKQLYEINKRTVNDVEIVDDQGELNISAADYQGPMVVIPVSDPRIYSDMQRMAQAQAIAARATQLLPLGIYDQRKVETNFLKQMGVADPETFFVKQPQPTRQNAVAENVAASQGQPIKAFSGQDHEAHISTHMAYLNSPIFGSNPAIATKYIPAVIPHLAEHLALWYSDAMLEAATEAVRAKTADESLMLNSLMSEGSEVPLDRLMAELDDFVLEHAANDLAPIPDTIQQAMDLLKELAPPMPMDPTAVAARDVQRQEIKDKREAEIKAADLETRRQTAAQAEETKRLKIERDAQLKSEQLAKDAQDSDADRLLKANVATAQNEVKLTTNQQDNLTALEITEMNNEAKLESAKEAAKGRAVTSGSPGSNVKTGTGINPGP